MFIFRTKASECILDLTWLFHHVTFSGQYNQYCTNDFPILVILTPQSSGYVTGLKISRDG